MVRKEVYFMVVFSLMLVFTLSFSLAEITIDLGNTPSAIEVFNGNSFNLTARINCAISDCNNISIGLMIPHTETNTINFSQSPGKDCFDGTCLIKPEGNGPLENVSGKVSWGCGKCYDNPIFVGENMKDLVESGCLSGMRNIVGVSLCVKTNNEAVWDLTFSHWPIGGIGDFVYTRIKDREIIKNSESSPFYIISKDLAPLNLKSSQSTLVTFEVKTNGEVNQNYALAFFSGYQETPAIKVAIKPVEIVVENTTNTIIESDSNKGHTSASQTYYGPSSQLPLNASTMEVSPDTNDSDQKLTGKIILSQTSKHISIWKILGIVFVILLVIFIALIVLINKKPKSSESVTIIFK